VAFQNTSIGMGVPLHDLYMKARVNEGTGHGLKGHKPPVRILRVLFHRVSHDPFHPEFGDNI
jgi:hypothetical protein